MKKILITGGSGFIGSHLCELLKEKYTIDIIDLRAPVPGSYSAFYEVDVSNMYELSKLKPFKEVDAVIHLAAQTSSIVSQEEPLLDYQSNILGTRNISYMCAENAIPLIFASSMAVYNTEQIDVETTPKPSSNYGISKYLGETFVRDLNKQSVNTSILRLFNVYGVGQDMTNMKQGMLSIFVAMAVNKHRITVKGTLDRTRDFIHVRDVCEMINHELSRVLFKDKMPCKTLNIASGQSISVSTLIQLICDNIEHDIEIDVQPGFAEDIKTVTCSDAQSFNRVPFSVGLKQFIDWAKSIRESET